MLEGNSFKQSHQSVLVSFTNIMRAIHLIRLVALFALSGCLAASAAELSGRVVGVHDGDTITVLDAGHKQYKIRLAGIDAPELKQAFGTRSRQNLSKWVYSRQVLVQGNKRDRYGRTVGVVSVDGHDVNLEQVRAGMAWWYRQYAKEQTADDRQLYELAENDARAAKRGLWVDPEPVPTWAGSISGLELIGGGASA